MKPSRSKLTIIVLTLCLGGLPLAAQPAAQPPAEEVECAKALAEVTNTDRDDPEVKVAVEAIQRIHRDAQAAGKAPDPADMEQAQLRLESVLLKKAAIRRADLRPAIERRHKKVQGRLDELSRAPRKQK
ncbi:hypothetical protein DB347_13520 [Opitutaceae bacterium EW11]|nr:hypothetical protein DB347_13520 [Opitutaceae bacterium EW11]